MASTISMPVPINDESTPLLPSNVVIDDQKPSEKLPVIWPPAFSPKLLEVKANNHISARETVEEQPRSIQSHDFEAQRDRLSYSRYFRPPPAEEIDIDSYLGRKRKPFVWLIFVTLVVVLLVHSVIGFLPKAKHHALFCPSDLSNGFWNFEFYLLGLWSKAWCDGLYGLRMWEKGAREWLEMERPEGWQKLVERYDRGGDVWLHIYGIAFVCWLVIVEVVL